MEDTANLDDTEILMFSVQKGVVRNMKILRDIGGFESIDDLIRIAVRDLNIKFTMCAHGFNKMVYISDEKQQGCSVEIPEAEPIREQWKEVVEDLGHSPGEVTIVELFERLDGEIEDDV